MANNLKYLFPREKAKHIYKKKTPEFERTFSFIFFSIFKIRMSFRGKLCKYSKIAQNRSAKFSRINKKAQKHSKSG